MDRLTKIELEDYCENAGLTNLQKDILRLKYFDPNEPTVVAICMKLNISERKFYRNQARLLNQIYKYEELKNAKIRTNK